MTASNTIGRANVGTPTNKSGGALAAGDVVIVDTSNNDAVTTTTSAAATVNVGVCLEAIANNAAGRVLFNGYAPLINVNASVTRGHYGATHTVAKQAADAGASRTTGTFVQFWTGGTTPDGWVFNPDLGTGGSTIITKDEGSTLSSSVTTLDFVGAGVVASGSGATTTVTVAGGGITRTTVGTTSIGASFDGTRRMYLKKVTLASAGFLASIIVGTRGNANNTTAMTVGVMSDNSGTPDSVIAVSGAIQKESDNSSMTQLLMSTTARSVHMPLGAWLTAADYWLCVILNSAADSRSDIAYSSGTGSDRTRAGFVFVDHSVLASSTGTNDYSIAASILR